MLKIEDLQVRLGEKEILTHIDLEIGPGETSHPFWSQRFWQDVPVNDHYGISPV